MIKVNFLIAGTQKGGTASMHKYLKQHADICVSNKKELHFFDQPKNFIDQSQLKKHYEQYLSHFNYQSNQRCLGEATPKYMYDLQAIQQIYKYNPDMKFILLLRNPVDRAFSHWNMSREAGFDKKSFSRVIREEMSELVAGDPTKKRRYSYIDRGLYAKQIKVLRQYFLPRNICVVKSSDMYNDPLHALNNVFKFLAVSDLKHIKTKHLNKREYPQAMLEDDKQLLRDVFRADILALEKMLGGNYSSWLEE